MEDCSHPSLHNASESSGIALIILGHWVVECRNWHGCTSQLGFRCSNPGGGTIVPVFSAIAGIRT